MKRLTDLQDLGGRVAVVTGGAGRLGLAFGEVLTELGASVVVVDVDLEASRTRAEHLARHAGVPCHAVAADLSDPAQPARIVNETIERFGRLDVLVNNAAFTGSSALEGWAVPFAEQRLPAWEGALRVNLTAPFLLTQAAAPALAASGRGSVINIGSIYGVVGPNFGLYADTTMGNPAAYAATKGGLLNLTRYLATALAPHVRVNAISPGGIAAGQPAIFRQRYEASTPLRRMGEPEDFKGVLAFLATDASAWMTGQDILVDGGWTAW